jgi:hypothetical protein
MSDTLVLYNPEWNELSTWTSGDTHPWNRCPAIYVKATLRYVKSLGFEVIGKL